MEAMSIPSRALPPKVKVLVVGAGPAGLMAALTLVARGIDCAIIDKIAPGRNVSRAAVTQSLTLEILAQFGIASPFLARANNQRAGNVWDRRRVIRVNNVGEPLDGLTPFPWISTAKQAVVEQVMHDELVRRGGGVVWPASFQGLKRLKGKGPAAETTGEGGKNLDGTEASTTNGHTAPDPDTDSDPDANYEITLADGRTVLTTYLIAADGMSSAVRGALGVPWSTDDLRPESAVISDVYLAHPRLDTLLPQASAASFLSPAGIFLVQAYKEAGHYRLISILNEGEEVPAAPTLDQVQHQLDTKGFEREVLGGEPIKVQRMTWSTRARFHEQVAERMQVDGTAFLVGDAAHVHPPTGGQGMNASIADAHFLGEALARVVDGGADPSILAEWERKRLATARRIVALSLQMLSGFRRAVGRGEAVSISQTPGRGPGPGSVSQTTAVAAGGSGGLEKEMLAGKEQGDGGESMSAGPDVPGAGTGAASTPTSAPIDDPQQQRQSPPPNPMMIMSQLVDRPEGWDPYAVGVI